MLVPGIRERNDTDVAECVKTLAQVHEAGGYPSNWPVDPARWLSPSGMYRAWICPSDDLGVAGHLLVTRVRGAWAGVTDSHGRAEVGCLFVSPSARGRGVASRLLQQAVLWAGRCRRDLVLEVADHLKTGIALYERMGWRQTETVLSDWAGPDGRRIPLRRYELCYDQR